MKQVGHHLGFVVLLLVVVVLVTLCRAQDDGVPVTVKTTNGQVQGVYCFRLFYFILFYFLPFIVILLLLVPLPLY